MIDSFLGYSKLLFLLSYFWGTQLAIKDTFFIIFLASLQFLLPFFVELFLIMMYTLYYKLRTTNEVLYASKSGTCLCQSL